MGCTEISFLSGRIKKSVRHLKVAFLCALVLFPLSAHADSTFLLQLGSFDSEAQASKKWEEVKGGNADVLGGLNLHIAQVALPPDNTVSYRTQAGSLPSRDQAAAACSILQSRHVECYVVETALLTTEQVPTQASAAPQPSSPPVQNLAAAPAAPMPILAEPTPSPANTTAIPYATTTAPSEISLSSDPNAVTAPLPTPTPIHAPLQGNLAQEITTPPVHNAPTAAPAQAAPVPEVIASAPSASVASGQEVAPGIFLLPASPSDTAASPAPVPPSDTEKPGFFGRLFGTSHAPKSATSDYDVSAEAPASPTAAPVPFVSAAPPANNTVGNVHVAEAIRVPLSSGKKHNLIVPNLPEVHGLGGLPSQSTHKTYWAQMGYFSNETAAQNFYQDFRAAYPQLANGVRVRITRPYESTSSVGRVSLRVGPFAGTNDVRTICIAASRRGLRCSLVRDLGLSAATENGINNHFYSHSRTVNHSGLSNSPFSSPFSGGSKYWIQLGTYPSQRDAWNEWKALQEEHQKLLGHVRGDVASPAMSSAVRSTYRLRAGPFMSNGSAASLCSNLQSSGVSCIVFSDQ